MTQLYSDARAAMTASKSAVNFPLPIWKLRSATPAMPSGTSLRTLLTNKNIANATAITGEIEVRSPRSNLTTAVRYRNNAGQLVELDGQQWHLAEGATTSAIPLVDPVGDRLAALAQQLPGNGTSTNLRLLREMLSSVCDSSTAT
jgi:hypothetical protein